MEMPQDSGAETQTSALTVICLDKIKHGMCAEWLEGQKLTITFVVGVRPKEQSKNGWLSASGQTLIHKPRTGVQHCSIV